MIAAIGGVLVGGVIFSGKVKDIETALQRANDKINGHLDKAKNGIAELETTVSGIGLKLSGIEEQFSATAQSLGQLRGSVDDLQNSAGPVEEQKNTEIEYNRDTVRNDWNEIRDKLEQNAADQSIDGRTRAKYTRIDRRRYNDLIYLLDKDGNLQNAALYSEAYGIWQKYRTGRSAVEPSDAKRLLQIRAELVGT